MNNLIDKVTRIQNDRQLTDRELGELLGVHRSTWAKIKSGTRKPGMKFLRAVNEKLMTVEISDIIALDAHQTHQNKILALLIAFRDRLYLWLRAV